jgi:hypothetical protein
MWQKITPEVPFTVEQFTAKIKEALKGQNAASDIQDAVALLIKNYGIKAPDKK